MMDRDKLQIEIEFGNAAMLHSEHAADALRQVADEVGAGETDGPIKDENGNAVGFYRTVCR